MFLVSGISLFFWLLLAYCAGQFTSIPFLDFSHVVYVHNKTFYLTTRDIFLMVGVVFLFFEIWKASTASKFGTTETVVSFFVATGYLILFITEEWAHNADFFILMMMAFVDAIGGFIVEVKAAQRDVKIS